MTQAKDTYDAHAAAWKKRLEEGNNPAHRWLEKPAMEAKLPNLTGKRVLCIGCGSGEETEMLFAAGAMSVHGIDVSERLVELACQSFPRASFEVKAMEDLAGYADGSFDLVYSSLTLHYSCDWRPILSQVARILAIGGTMLFSTHHPVKWGSEVARGDVDVFRMGYARPKTGMPDVFGNYLGTRLIEDTWFGDMKVQYFHRPLDAIMRDVLTSGLRIVDFVEPAPVAEAEHAAPGFWAIHSRIPLFIIFELRREGNA